MNGLDGFKAVAFQARREFECRSVSRQLLSKLYLVYNPEVGDVESFLDQAELRFPEGNCGLASLYIRHLLQEGSLVRGHYRSDSHTFLALGVLIIDITADQYGGPEVYVGPVTTPWSME